MALSESELQAFSDFEKSGWDRAADPYHHHWGALSQQSAGPMLDAAGVEAGVRVLDVATGAGYVAAVAAKRGARATGLDFSGVTIALARKVHPQVEFCQGDAEDLPFGENSFDAVVSGFGINHLPHPEKGFAEAFRVLRSGGIFAFTVWAAPKPGEGFGIVLGAIERLGDLVVKLPPAPPYFRFANAREAEGVFEQTGFASAQTRIVPQFWRHRTSDQVFDAFHDGSVRATAMLRAQPQAAREKIRAAVRAEVERLGDGTQYVVPVPAALSWAIKP